MKKLNGLQKLLHQSQIKPFPKTPANCCFCFSIVIVVVVEVVVVVVVVVVVIVVVIIIIQQDNPGKQTRPDRVVKSHNDKTCSQRYVCV